MGAPGENQDREPVEPNKKIRGVVTIAWNECEGQIKCVGITQGGKRREVVSENLEDGLMATLIELGLIQIETETKS